jgi:hypothetical protein
LNHEIFKAQDKGLGIIGVLQLQGIHISKLFCVKKGVTLTTTQVINVLLS